MWESLVGADGQFPDRLHGTAQGAPEKAGLDERNAKTVHGDSLCNFFAFSGRFLMK